MRTVPKGPLAAPRIVFYALLALAAVPALRATPAERLEILARFVVDHYEIGTPLATSEISFTAPLLGEPVTFRHFAWTITFRDQYGQKLSEPLTGFVRYGDNGLAQLVVDGPLVKSDQLRKLRASLGRTGRLPKDGADLLFGPSRDRKDLETMARSVIEGLLCSKADIAAAKFQLTNDAGAPDATWHVSARGTYRTIDARFEPFSGRLVQLDVVATNGK